MIICKCDICGEEQKKPSDLITLHKEYTLDDVEDVCNDCNNKLSDKIAEEHEVFKKELASTVKGYIKEIKSDD